MGKVEQQNEAVAPGISPQTEASKLLEAALMQMDGIISVKPPVAGKISENLLSLTPATPSTGNSNSARSPHTPTEFTVSTPSVRDAVVALVGAIQTHPPPPPPDPVTARTILQWLQEEKSASRTSQSSSPGTTEERLGGDNRHEIRSNHHLQIRQTHESRNCNLSATALKTETPPTGGRESECVVRNSSSREDWTSEKVDVVKEPLNYLPSSRASSSAKQTPSSAGATTSPTYTDSKNSSRCLGSAYKQFTSQRDPPPCQPRTVAVPAAVGGDVSIVRDGDGIGDQRNSVFSTASAADEDFASAVKDFQVTAQEVQNIVHLDAITKSTGPHHHQRTPSISQQLDRGVVYRNANGPSSHTNGFHQHHLHHQQQQPHPNEHHHHHQRTFSSTNDDFDSHQTQTQNQRHSSTTDYSGTASDEENGLCSDEEDSEDSNDADSSTTESDTSSSESGRELVVREGGLETITEEDRVTASAASSVHSVEDSSTRCNGDFQWIRQEIPTQASKMPEHTHTKPLPPLKMEDPHQNHQQQLQQQQPTNPQTKPPINRTVRDKTPRRHSGEKASSGTAAGTTASLDRRRHHLHQNRHERDQKSKSTHCPAKSPPKLDDFYASATSCQNWCCSGGPWQPPPEPPVCYENFHRRHERMDPQRYGSSPMLMDHQRGYERGSHPDLYAHRHDVGGGCCAYHLAPPPLPMSCCHYGDARNYWASVAKPPEQDERIRKLQSEKDNLQLQVAVLNEQIEAQCDKIGELEKALSDKKQQLGNAEEVLQREMLSRSSLETQKLEFMTAISELKLQQASLERENMELKSHQYNNNSGIKKPPLLPRSSPQPQLTSTPIHHSSNQMLNVGVSPSPSPVYAGSFAGLSPRRIDAGSLQQHQQQQLPPPKTPPANYRRQIELHYGSLPRQQFISNGSTLSTVDSNANPSNAARKGVAFGKGFSTLLGGKAKGQSVPNLGADTEKIMIDDDDNSSQQSPSLQFNKNKGIKKIFGRMRRSGSGNLEDLPGEGEFKRGGVRATAGPRLGWSEPPPREKPQAPFSEWDTEIICDWLQDLGLDSYVTEAKRWVKSGAQLQTASMNEVEKELGIKNLMHRKKLQLALMDAQENATTDTYLASAGQLDTAWVLRWLDDTGLPQHKEAFSQNGVDGRMLHRMTMDDLAVLHVTSLLHVASLKRGIQVLREHNFEPGCLQRRSLPDDSPQPLPQQVALWSSHRVMEWLRAVDLAEYAPNLRGAGVHGALMVLEPKFTAELLAALLSIPPSKTLLRRHLNTHFKELLGRDIIQEKRDAEATLGYIPLTPASKLKITKKSQFSLKRKKSKGEMDYGDLVCPLNTSQSGDLNGSTISNNSVGMTKMEEVKEEDVCLHVDSPNLSRSGTPSPRHHESN